MLKFLKELFGRGESESREADRLIRQYQQLKADLGADLPLEDLRPVLIPSSILAGGNWVGPHHHFPDLPLSLTWAYQRPECTMQYLTQDQVDKLTADGVDWRSAAKTALDADSKARTWTFRRSPEDESTCAAIVLHDDLGPSRLLCLEQIEEMIPDGFSFFVPDRNVVFLLADAAPREIRDQMAEWVHKAYREAEVSLSLEGYSHTLLKSALKGAAYSEGLRRNPSSA